MENFGKLKKEIIHNDNVSRMMENFENDWDVYDSNLIDIGSSFYKTLPEYDKEGSNYPNITIEEQGLAFKNYIQKSLEKSEDRTAVEFGGPGANLFRGFDSGFFKNTIGVCLEDIRFKEEKEQDEKIHHEIVTGNILNPDDNELFDKIFQKFEKKEIDLIISRIMGPIEEMKVSPILLEHIIRKWFSLLSAEGILFGQFMYFREHDPDIDKKIQSEKEQDSIQEIEKIVSNWAEIIREKLPGLIDIQIGRGVIRIKKNKGAPKILPKIDSKLN